MKYIIALVLSLNVSAISCFGTEPFWSAQVNEDAVIVSSFTESKTYKTEGVKYAQGMPQNSNSFLISYTDTNGPVATVIGQKCNDGMSDKVYPKEVVLYLGEKLLYGCCD